MTEYWKSLPKKFCDVCKVWFTDNKASVDFHESGLKHKGNVQRRLTELRRNGTTQQKEQEKYNAEMMRIEAAAMGSFQKDISANPKLASQLSSSSSLINSLPVVEGPSSATGGGGRWGDDFSKDTSESQTLVRGRERALDTIAKRLEKKSKWLEAQTAEGKTYYWHKDTYETVWEKPKHGFMSNEEQKSMSMSGPPPSVATASADYKYDPYGKWQGVDNRPYDDQMPDLQLPDGICVDLDTIEAPKVEKAEKKKIEFKERTVDEVKTKAAFKKGSETFKKRKAPDGLKRNVRQRGDDD